MVRHDLVPMVLDQSDQLRNALQEFSLMHFAHPFIPFHLAIRIMASFTAALFDTKELFLDQLVYSYGEALCFALQNGQ